MRGRRELRDAPEFPSAESGRSGRPRYSLNSDADPCIITAAVSQLPGSCGTAEDSVTANTLSSADSAGRVIVTFEIGCTASADPGDPGDPGDDPEPIGPPMPEPMSPPRDAPTG